MQVKTFEIRDSGTFIPVIAVKLTSNGDKNEAYLLRRVGLDKEGSYRILLTSLNDGKSCVDPCAWPNANWVRTMPIAHDYIDKNFDSLESGAVVDVQYIIGETKEPKKSEKILHIGLL